MQVSLITAFIAGLLSFISPCVLPLVPGYISFISGVSLEEMKRTNDVSNRSRILKKVAINSVLFILGFSIVFILLGATATYIGGFLQSKMNVLSKIAGVVVIIFGLHTAGLFNIKFLQYEKRFQTRGKPLTLIGSLLIGMAFAFGWSPCIGPILAAILVYASTQETVYQGIGLLASYSLGLGIPFFIAGLAVNVFFGVFNWMKKYLHAIEIIAGVFLIVLGILIFTNQLQVLAAKITFFEKFNL
ncbi:MAG: cytochrome c biogenesis protein CcdA [bacterium]|nr:cytochrome c biogenesis protein CcdA [bacterium]